MRRFQRALTREMAASAGLAFIALGAIFSVVLLVRILGKAAIGDLDVEAVLPMLGFGLLRALPVLLSLGLFIGVFISLSRLWRDSEAVIWMNGGVGPWGWARPIIVFVMPVVLIIAFVSLEALAWGARKQGEFEQILASRDQISNLSAGVFTEDRQGKRVVFVEKISNDGVMVENVFVQSFERGRMGVTIARQGSIKQMDNGDTFLQLEQGKRYEGVPGAADFRLAQFSLYAVRVPPQVVAERGLTKRSMPAADLLRNPTPLNMGEWVSRLSFPISALLLCLLAVPLSYANPRAGRSMNVVFTVLIYAAYNNFVGLSQGWVEREKMDAWMSLLLVHGSMVLILLAMFWRRFRGPWAA
jgi:lipopolysaccharide export system permease protein